MQKSLITFLGAAAVVALGSGLAQAQEKVEIPVNLISDKGVGMAIGKITAEDTKNGFLALHFDLAAELPAGGHGTHSHEIPSVAV